VTTSVSKATAKLKSAPDEVEEIFSTLARGRKKNDEKRKKPLKRKSLREDDDDDDEHFWGRGGGGEDEGGYDDAWESMKTRSSRDDEGGNNGTSKRTRRTYGEDVDPLLNLLALSAGMDGYLAQQVMGHDVNVWEGERRPKAGKGRGK